MVFSKSNWTGLTVPARESIPQKVSLPQSNLLLVIRVDLCTVNTLICSPHLYSSFNTFGIQIGKLFAARWVFEYLKNFELIFKHTETRKTWIYLTPYVCTDRIFDSRPFNFMNNKIFLKKLLYKILAYIFTLLLAPFASKLVNYSRHSESLKNVWKQ